MILAGDLDGAQNELENIRFKELDSLPDPSEVSEGSVCYYDDHLWIFDGDAWTELLSSVAIDESSDLSDTENLLVRGNADIRQRLTANYITVHHQLVSEEETILNSLNVIDNIIKINYNEQSSSVSDGIAGIQIDRGTSTPVYIYFDESVHRWVLSNDGLHREAILTDGYTGSNVYLRTDGLNSPINDISMDNHGLLNLRDPINDTDAVNKQYVDNNFIDKNATNKLEANLDLNNHRILNLDNPVNSQDAATKGYVDASILSSGQGQFLALNGTNTPLNNISWNNNRITNLASPVDSQDAATKNYVDTSISSSGTLYFRRDGSAPPLAHITWNNYRITDLSTPLNDNDAATKAYVDINLNDIYNDALHKDGTNSPSHDISWNSFRLTNLADPIDNYDAANKKYVEDRILDHGSLHDSTYLRLDGTNLPAANISWNNFRITNLSDPQSLSDAATKSYVDNNISSLSSNVLHKDGSVIPTNDLSMGSHKITNLIDPANSQDAATKNYVDTEIDSTGSNLFLRRNGSNRPLSNIDWNGFKIQNLSNPSDNKDAATKEYVDTEIDSTGRSYFLSLDGSNSPTAYISWNNNKITNLATPTNDYDAANKIYIDDRIQNHDSEHNDVFLRLDGTNDISANINFNNNRAINLANPVNDHDAVNKWYVDSKIQGLDWQDSVIAIEDIPPDTPSTGDRYLIADNPVNDWTGFDNYITEYTGTDWNFIVPTEGTALWVEFEDTTYVYNGASWVKLGSTSQHNNLAGLQGGSVNEYYHLSSTNYNMLTASLNADSLHTHTISNADDVQFLNIDQYDVLMYDGSRWTNGLILDEHISVGAAIDWSKIDKTGSRLDDFDDVPTTSGGTSGYLKTDGSGNLTWNQLTKSDITDFEETDYIHVSGNETVSGIKTFTSIPIVPSTDPTTDNQITRKAYVDAKILSTGNSTYLRLDGINAPMTGHLDMGDHRITNLASPTDDNDAVKKLYVDTLNSNLSSAVLHLDGSTTPNADISWNSRKITDLADPLNNTDATNKQYVDSTIDTIGTTLFLRLDGSTVPNENISWNSKKIIDLADPTDNQDATNKQYVDSKISTVGDSTYLRLDGSNSPMTGNLQLGDGTTNYNIQNLANPLNPQDAATKNYIDSNYLALDGSTIPTNNISLGTYRIVNLGDPINAQDATTKDYVDYVISDHDDEHNDTFLRLDGTNLPIANLNLNSHKLINVLDPEDNQDAATKAYVDSKIQGLDWQDSVIAIEDIPPTNPSTGDRYIVGIDPINEWDGFDNYIVEYNGSDWDFIAPNEGFTTWVEFDTVNYTFNGASWVKFGSTVDHNNLMGIQGGTANEYYHLTNNEHSLLTTNQNADSLHSHTLSNLDEVNLNTLTVDQILVYNGTNWINNFITDDNIDTNAEIEWSKISKVNSKIEDIDNVPTTNTGYIGYLRTDGTGILTWDELTKSDITDFTESDYVHTSNDETILGTKTFNSIPVLPSTNPTSDNEATRKAYVDSAIVSIGNNEYLRLDGSNTPTADISWNSNKLTNLADPIDNQDAATKNYVDSEVNTLSNAVLHLDGSTSPTTNISWNNHKITHLYDPSDSQDAATKNYVDTELTNTGTSLYLRLDGTNSPTANISLNNHNITNLNSPVNSNDAVNKYYVDTNISSLVNTYLKLDGTNAPMAGNLQMGDGTTNYKITNLLDPTNNQDAATKIYVDTVADLYLKRDGSNSPTANIDWNSHGITNLSDPTNNQDAATKNYVDTQISNIDYDSTYLKLDGSNSPIASIDWNFHNILNVADPINDQDAATKAYVDSKIQGLDWQDSVLDKDITDPSTLTPSTGDRYIVASGAVNDWASHDNEIAEYDGAVWQFTTPNEGFSTWVEDENINYTYNGSSWIKIGSTIDHNNLQNLQGGTANEYYHLTQNQYSLLTSGSNADSIHIHSLENLSDTNLASLSSGYGLVYDGSKWISKSLTKSDISDFTESDYVHLSGTEDISGQKNFLTIPTTPNDPTTDNQITRKAYVDSKISTVGDSTYLRLDGTNSPTADISISNHKIINLSNPTNNQDAANKQYVDSEISNLSDSVLHIDGSNTPTTDISWNAYKITNLADPTSSQDAATKNYVDDNIASGGALLFLKLDGSNTPSADISWNNHKITNLADPINSQDAVNKGYISTNYLKLDGTNTPTSDISMGSHRITDLVDPSNNQDATTKSYVDSADTTYYNNSLHVDGSNTPTTDISWNSNKLTNLADPTSNQDAATKNYVDYQIQNHDDEHNDTFLRIDGTNNPTANIDWGYNKITNLKSPEDGFDAVNKYYVDFTVAAMYAYGLFMGGIRGSWVKNTIDYVSIDGWGDAIDFGDLDTRLQGVSASSNGSWDTAVIFGGYYSGSYYNTIETIESISSPSDASDTGTLSTALFNIKSVDNNIHDRAVAVGGEDSSTITDNMEYVTTSTQMNSLSYGTLDVARARGQSTSNGVRDRALILGGHNSSGILDSTAYFNISVLSPTVYSGPTLMRATQYHAAVSNHTSARALIIGGHDGSNILGYVDYINMDTMSNATNYGSLDTAAQQLAGTSNGVRGKAVVGGGEDSGGNDLYDIQFISIDTGGTADQFGDLTVARSQIGSTSNA